MAENKENVTSFNNQGVDLKPRAMKVLEQRTTGIKQKQVSQIAKELGVNRRTIYRDIIEIKESQWFEKQIEKMQTVEGLVFSGFLAQILNANPDLIKSYYKGLGVWRDKLEVSGSIEQKLSDEEITDKAKQVILDVIRETKTKIQNVSRETKVLQSGQDESQDDKT